MIVSTDPSPVNLPNITIFVTIFDWQGEMLRVCVSHGVPSKPWMPSFKAEALAVAARGLRAIFSLACLMKAAVASKSPSHVCTANVRFGGQKRTWPATR